LSNGSQAAARDRGAERETPERVRLEGRQDLERVPAAGDVLRARLLLAAVLILAGLLWATARGLHFYGFTPVEIVYDFDQPPVLLACVGVWLLYRSVGR
jgi:hypothetical protein